MNERLRQIAPEVAQRLPNLSSGQLGQSQIGQTQPGQSQLGQTQPGQTQPGQTQPGIGQDESRTQRAYRSDQESELSGQSIEQICQIRDQIAQNSLQRSKQLLDQYEDKDFDMGYLGHQIVSHNMALAALNAVAESSVGGQEFQQVVQTAKQGVQQHLDEAKDLARQVADSSGQQRSDTGTQPRSATQPRGSEQPGTGTQPGQGSRPGTELDTRPGAGSRSGSATQPGSAARPGSLPDRD